MPSSYISYKGKKEEKNRKNKLVYYFLIKFFVCKKIKEKETIYDLSL